jgi:hypothetical protein
MRWATQIEGVHGEWLVCHISNNDLKYVERETCELKANPYAKKGKNDSARVMHTV